LAVAGPPRGALHFQQQALAIRRRVLGDEHPDTLTAMNNLALTLWNQGDRAAGGDFRSRCWPSAAACWATSTPTR
jgi:hypothetical protein